VHSFAFCYSMLRANSPRLLEVQLETTTYPGVGVVSKRIKASRRPAVTSQIDCVSPNFSLHVVYIFTYIIQSLFSPKIIVLCLISDCEV
jgi:hypothetical protein